MPLMSQGSQISISATMVDEVSGKLQKLEGGFNKLSQSVKTSTQRMSMAWTEFRSAYLVVVQAVQTGVQAFHAATDAFKEYATQVNETSRKLGTSTEEASRLIQVADDVFISYDKMTTAMTIAQKKGITPNIEGLAKLAEQYSKLAPGTERMKFLLDNFGKSGAEMGKLMELGADGIRSAGEAVDGSLVLTQEAVNVNKLYKQSIDEMGDAWNDLTFRAAPALEKAMTDVIATVTLGIKATSSFSDYLSGKIDFTELQRLAAEASEDYKRTLDGVAPAITEAAIATDEYNKETARMPARTHEAADALKELEKRFTEMSKANESALDFLLSYTDSAQSYAESHAKALDDVRVAQEKLNEAIARGESPETIEGLRDNLADAQKGMQDLEVQWIKSTDRMVYETVRQKLAVDGLTDAEYSAMLQLGEQMGIYTAEQARAAQELYDRANAIAESLLLREDVKGQQNEMDVQRAELAAAAKAEEEGIAQAVSETADAKADVAQNAQDAVAATQGESAAVQSVTASINESIAAQNALSAQIQNAVNIIYAEVNAQAALTSSIWQSVEAQNALNAAMNAQPIETRDAGGPGIAGVPYMIGKGAQPEIFVPKTDGYFYPRGKTPGGSNGGGGVNVTIINPQPEAAENSIRRQLKKLSYMGIVQ